MSDSFLKYPYLSYNVICTGQTRVQHVNMYQIFFERKPFQNYSHLSFVDYFKLFDNSNHTEILFSPVRRYTNRKYFDFQMVRVPLVFRSLSKQLSRRPYCRVNYCILRLRGAHVTRLRNTLVFRKVHFGLWCGKTVIERL